MKVYAVMTDEKFDIVFGEMAGKIVHVDCGEQRKAVYCGIDVTSSDEFEEMDKGAVLDSLQNLSGISLHGGDFIGFMLS